MNKKNKGELYDAIVHYTEQTAMSIICGREGDYPNHIFGAESKIRFVERGRHMKKARERLKKALQKI